MTPRKSDPKPKTTKGAKTPASSGPARASAARGAGSPTSKSKAAAKPAKSSSPKAAKRAPRVEEPFPARRVAGASFSPTERERIERILLTERGRLLKEMGHLEDTVLNRSLRDASGELSGYSFHMADIGTDAMEREKAFLFASTEGRALIDVNDALRRLYNGEYGICEVCGQPISIARLEVVPQARLCVNCKEREERGQSGRAR